MPNLGFPPKNLVAARWRLALLPQLTGNRSELASTTERQRRDRFDVTDYRYAICPQESPKKEKADACKKMMLGSVNSCSNSLVIMD